MIELTDEMREHVNNALANSFPCILATSSKDGVPGLGFRGSMMVYDDEHLALLERAEAVVEAGCFPVDRSGRRYPWPLV